MIETNGLLTRILFTLKRLSIIQKIKLDSQDEIGIWAMQMNFFLGNRRELFSKIHETSNFLHNTAREILLAFKVQLKYGEIMKKMFAIIALIIAFALAPALAADEKDITEAQAIAKVQQTAKAIAKDAQATFAKIIAGEAPFKDKENPALYVFVYDPDVNMVAHPNKDLMGKHFKGKPDVRGKKFRDDIVSLALTKGKGWTDYHYQKPGETGIFEKTTYGEKVIGSDGKVYIVACGKYK